MIAHLLAGALALGKRLGARLGCILCGHLVERTGRHGIALYQVRCVECERLFMKHLDHGDAMLIWDRECERFAQDHGW